MKKEDISGKKEACCSKKHAPKIIEINDPKESVIKLAAKSVLVERQEHGKDSDHFRTVVLRLFTVNNLRTTVLKWSESLPCSCLSTRTLLAASLITLSLGSLISIIFGACFLEQQASFFPLISSFFIGRSEEHTSELQSRLHLVCR